MLTWKQFFPAVTLDGRSPAVLENVRKKACESWNKLPPSTAEVELFEPSAVYMGAWYFIHLHYTQFQERNMSAANQGILTISEFSGKFMDCNQVAIYNWWFLIYVTTLNYKYQFYQHELLHWSTFPTIINLSFFFTNLTSPSLVFLFGFKKNGNFLPSFFFPGQVWGSTLQCGCGRRLGLRPLLSLSFGNPDGQVLA